MKSKCSEGYSLVEILVALTLIGILATFTIPKLISSQGSEASKAKLRQTTATLEQVFTTLKMQGRLRYGESLYFSMVENLNLVSSDYHLASNIAIQNGGPLYSASVSSSGTNHPCYTEVTVKMQDHKDVLQSWAEFPNGVVITGLYRDDITEVLDNKPWDDALHDELHNHVLCIDVNGAQGPNTFGNDVFIGNFNMWGAFEGTPNSNGKAFRWGGDGVNLYDSNGNVLGGVNGVGNPANSARAHAGFYLND